MRIVMKISGEALKGDTNISLDMLETLFSEIKVLAKDHELLLVIGGGNFWRGRNDLAITHAHSDQMGMLATTMNGIAVASYLNMHGILTDLYTAFSIEGIGKRYCYDDVIDSFLQHHVVLLSGGLGVPHFSTDMVTVQKAEEIHADLILMAKNVDGIYDKDPRYYSDAKKWTNMTHEQLLNQQLSLGISSLGIIDLEAMIALCKSKIPVYFYSAKEKNGALSYLEGTFTGTIVRS